MEVVLHQDVREFAALAQPFYAGDPDLHTVALSVLDAMVRHGDPYGVLATVHDGGSVVGALLGSEGRPPTVSGIAPDQAKAVVAALADAGLHATGARGPIDRARAFAAAHVARHGGEVRLGRETRLFALDTLVPPRGVPGVARRATPADAELIMGWRAAFFAEAAPPGEFRPDLDDIARTLARPDSGEQLWTVDGLPVSQATPRPPVVGMSRIGPVFTPPEQRGRGYAAAVTAAAAQWALAAGAGRVLLFTDLANATTNRLYPRLGFRPVADYLDLDFPP